MTSVSTASVSWLRPYGDRRRNLDDCGRLIVDKGTPRNSNLFLSRARGFRQLSLGRRGLLLAACAPSPSQPQLPPPPPPPPPSGPVQLGKRLYVSGLSFRTTEEGLRNAFKKFGELVEVNLVMDSIARRPRGFAFLRYSTEEESQRAIEGMHGNVRNVLKSSRLSLKHSDHQFSDGGVIFQIRVNEGLVHLDELNRLLNPSCLEYWGESDEGKSGTRSAGERTLGIPMWTEPSPSDYMLGTTDSC